ncbi:PQQ-dependent sugar dehydrogenase [Roseovarius nubinhibens]|uniref:PQQ-dependent sugar dehydrogenase n=1 Tax=Roseovarius nubinhibens TaxID=314263 RepID=UPI001FEC06BB|nr:PQQ-dependent sugar dehydrogenase [Roseovarius nubinhibens]
MPRFPMIIACLALWALPLQALESSQGALRVEEKAQGLSAPWGFGFLPSGEVLITEKAGRLLRLDPDGGLSEVAGLGEIANRGQGGLLDILVPGDFETRRELFFTFAKPQGQGEGTAVARARLSPAGDTLQDWTVIYEMTPGSSGGRHFGSRLVEASDGTLFVTIGERGDRPSAQDLSRENGSVLRITRAGDVPRDNPFVGQEGARGAIWSYGHRNPQGAALNLDGQLWVSEHGAKGGDEVNRVVKGANYGWPVISYGRHYSGAKIGEGTAKSGMEQPAHYWDPSIAPSGLMIYSGALWPEWRGDLFTGSLKFGFLSRLDSSESSGDGWAEERIEGPETGRLRDLREAPDGAIWILSEEQGALYRLSP